MPMKGKAVKQSEKAKPKKKVEQKVAKKAENKLKKKIVESDKAPKTNLGKSRADGTWGVYPKSISRIETEMYNAWFVRIYFQGVYVRRTFNDNLYGGKESGLREAIQWRDDMERQMGKPRTERSVRKKTVVDGRDIGVHRRNARHVKRGRVYQRDIYEVTWTPEPGKVSRTTVSITK